VECGLRPRIGTQVGLRRAFHTQVPSVQVVAQDMSSDALPGLLGADTEEAEEAEDGEEDSQFHHHDQDLVVLPTTTPFLPSASALLCAPPPPLSLSLSLSLSPLSRHGVSGSARLFGHSPPAPLVVKTHTPVIAPWWLESPAPRRDNTTLLLHRKECAAATTLCKDADSCKDRSV
jgi:hypothetical protein